MELFLQLLLQLLPSISLPQLNPLNIHNMSIIGWPYLARRASGKEMALLPFPPLRTVRESFPSYGSSLFKAPFQEPVSPPLTFGCVFVYGN